MAASGDGCDLSRWKASLMPMTLSSLALAASAAVVTLTIAAAPTAAAQPSQTCTDLTTSSTICESPGNAEVDDSLTRADTSPQWSSFGEQSGGPFGGSLGGGSR